jgi:histo-blood group ABO system transferase
MEPLVSVIIPVYNRQNLLPLTVKSIMNQNYKNIEIILVDDWSTDNSWSVINQLSIKYKNIKCCKTAYNSGSSCARNVGYTLVHNDSKYILPHDSDDISKPQKIKRLVDELENNLDLDAVGCLGEYIDDTGRLMGRSPKVKLDYNDIYSSFHRINHFLTGSVLIRKSVFNEVQPYTGIYFDDYTFWSNFLQKGFKVKNAPFIGLQVRRHSGRKSDAGNQNHRKIRLTEIQNEYTNFIHTKHISGEISIKVGLIIISTNKYIDMGIDSLVSALKYFCPNMNTRFFFITDQPSKLKDINDKRVTIIYQEHEDWPGPTLKRYHYFLKNEQVFEEVDYLYYVDSDMKFVDYIGNEILGELVATDHPAFFNKSRINYTYETNPKSTAYIKPDEGTKYFIGSFQGGSTTKFIDMSKKIARNVDVDLQNKIIAKWHDESHFNRYLVDNPPTHILPPLYSYPEKSQNVRNCPGSPKILALPKDHNIVRENKKESEYISKQIVNVNHVITTLSEPTFKLLWFEKSQDVIRNEKFNLKDVTFVIPVRIDSPERDFNIRMLLSYIQQYFDTNIHIVESGIEQKLHAFSGLGYDFIKMDNSIFHKNLMVNIALQKCKTPYVCVTDSDVVVKDSAYVESVVLLRKNKVDIVYPFDNTYINVTDEKSKDIFRVYRNLDNVCGKIVKDRFPQYGGIYFGNLESIKQAGYENQNMVSWGYDTLERYYRYGILGYKIGLIRGRNMYHLDHPCHTVSTKNHSYYNSNYNELCHISNMNRNELRDYISLWYNRF